MQAKKVTKKQRKAAAKAARTLREQNPKPAHEHHHDMNCLTSYLERQAQKKQEKAQLRNEKRQAKPQLRKLARQLEKTRKAASRKKREEREAANAQ